MTITFYFGKQKKPLKTENGFIVGERPYFSIMSRGMQMLSGWKAEEWERLAPKLDWIIRGISDAGEERVLKACYGLDVLTFFDTTRAIRIFLEKHGSRIVASLSPEESGELPDLSFEAWYQKEGHTSSVWKVRTTNGNKVSFALNVGRDKLANKELWDSSSRMERIQEQNPGLPLAQVLQKDKLLLPGIDYEAVVAANRWIENSRELHLVNDADSGEQFLFAIDEFIYDEGRISQIKGRSLTEQESDAVWSQIRDFKNKAAYRDGKTNKRIPPEFEINEGDVVIRAGQVFFVGLN